jgi:glycosyltransferase involved in cell wall biosynthesis
MNNIPLVSVVTAFYNEEKFLEETILSVVHQSYPHWELILVDDGSPDSSTLIAKKYAELYPGRIHYFQHEHHANRGVCRSRNLGIANAKGELIAYLDADDVWLENKLADQVTIFQQHPDTSVLMEASRYWYSWESPDRDDVDVQIGATQDRLYPPPELVISLYPLGEGAAPCPSGMMVRKKVHDKIRFVEDFIGPTAVYEDQAFLAQLYLNENVFVSSRVNNLYRQRVASQVYNVHQDGRYHEVRYFYLQWFENYLLAKRISDSRIQKLLRKAMFPYERPIIYKIWKKLKGILPRSN